MNRLRFGALLMHGQHFGFYLSHRVVLTVPQPGVIRAAALSDFLPAKVLAVDGVAVSFFEAMTTAANCPDAFSCSFDMVKQMLDVSQELSMTAFKKLLKWRYDAALVDFTIPEPQTENTNTGETSMTLAVALKYGTTSTGYPDSSTVIRIESPSDRIADAKELIMAQ